MKILILLHLLYELLISSTSSGPLQHSFIDSTWNIIFDFNKQEKKKRVGLAVHFLAVIGFNVHDKKS